MASENTASVTREQEAEQQWLEGEIKKKADEEEKVLAKNDLDKCVHDLPELQNSEEGLFYFAEKMPKNMVNRRHRSLMYKEKRLELLEIRIAKCSANAELHSLLSELVAKAKRIVKIWRPLLERGFKEITKRLKEYRLLARSKTAEARAKNKPKINRKPARSKALEAKVQDKATRKTGGQAKGGGQDGGGAGGTERGGGAAMRSGAVKQKHKKPRHENSETPNKTEQGRQASVAAVGAASAAGRTAAIDPHAYRVQDLSNIMENCNLEDERVGVSGGKRNGLTGGRYEAHIDVDRQIHGRHPSNCGKCGTPFFPTKNFCGPPANLRCKECRDQRGEQRGDQRGRLIGRHAGGKRDSRVRLTSHSSTKNWGMMHGRRYF